MKLLHALPPVAALVAGGLWTGFQHQRLGTLESESNLLRSSIDSARRADAAGPSSSAQGSRGGHGVKTTASDKKIDWKKILEMQRTRSNEGPDIRLMVEIQKKLTNMTEEELTAQLDEIAALEMPDTDKVELQSMLIGILAQKNPKLVLDRFANLIGNGRMNWQINDAFQRWAAKDTAAATAWMDQQIAAGTFDSKTLDGKSSARMQFEGSLVASLLQSDPKAAEERLKALPEEQRADIFNNMFFRMKPGAGKATIEAMRATVPASQYEITLNNAAQQIARQGLDKMSDLITQTDATPRERAVMVSAAFQGQISIYNSDATPDAAKIDEIRAWGMKQAPEVVDRSTGEALGNAASRGSFEATSQLAVKYAQESGNDEVLVAFLESGGAQRNAHDALPLVDRISDPAKRERIRGILQPQDNGQNNH